MKNSGGLKAVLTVCFIDFSLICCGTKTPSFIRTHIVTVRLTITDSKQKLQAFEKITVFLYKI